MFKHAAFALCALSMACATAPKPVATAPAADPACADHTGMQKMASAEAPAVKAFDHKPKVGETAICPVSNEKFVVGEDAKIIEYKGKWYAFFCDDCAPAFEKDPASFAAQ